MQTQVVCELPELQTAQGAPVWGQLLAGLLKGLEQRKLEQENGVGDVPDNLEDLAEENQVLTNVLPWKSNLQGICLWVLQQVIST